MLIFQQRSDPTLSKTTLTLIIEVPICKSKTFKA
jgi:hypothetical protein